MPNAAHPASPWYSRKLGPSILACLIAAASLLVAMGAAAMTWPPGYDLEVTRSFEYENENIPLGQPVQATWTISLPPASTLSGLYFAEQYPEWLEVYDCTATLNGEPVEIFHEIGSLGESVPGLVPHRMLFWDPTKPWLDVVIDSDDALLVEYYLVSHTSGTVQTLHNQWCGTLHMGGDMITGGWDEHIPFLDFGSTPVASDAFRVVDAGDHLSLGWNLNVISDSEIVGLLRSLDDNPRGAVLLHSWRQPQPGQYGYEDYAVQAGYEYHYWLAVLDEDGQVDRLLASAQGRLAQAILARLQPAYPNPFNPRTHLIVTLQQEQKLELALFDDRGRKLRSLIAGVWPAGRHELAWDGRDDAGNALPSGVYFARLLLEDQPTQVQKLTLLR